MLRPLEQYEIVTLVILRFKPAAWSVLLFPQLTLLLEQNKPGLKCMGELKPCPYIGCSERRLIDILFTVGTSCERAAPLAEKKCRRAAPRTEKSDKPAQ
jgi:hypothetical protein